MPNGQTFMEGLKLEEHLRGMSDREVLEFTARECYQTAKLVGFNSIRITKLEKRSNKIIGLAGGIGTTIGAMLVGVIDYLIRRGG